MDAAARGGGGLNGPAEPEKHVAHLVELALVHRLGRRTRGADGLPHEGHNALLEPCLASRASGEFFVQHPQGLVDGIVQRLGLVVLAGLQQVPDLQVVGGVGLCREVDVAASSELMADGLDRRRCR